MTEVVFVKYFPVIVSVVPLVANIGVKLFMIGVGGNTTKPLLLILPLQ